MSGIAWQEDEHLKFKTAKACLVIARIAHDKAKKESKEDPRND